MGLIFPSEGSIYFEGKPVYPGSAALANLGSFVEGPGFLPHLTGRENLNLYWKSIGRTGDNYLDEVVSITRSEEHTSDSSHSQQSRMPSSA